MLLNIQWFTNAFWHIVWIPDIILSYSDDALHGDLNMLVMNSML